MLTRRVFAASLLALLVAPRQKLLAAPSRTVHVRAKETSIRLFIDGKEIGISSDGLWTTSKTHDEFDFSFTAVGSRICLRDA